MPLGWAILPSPLPFFLSLKAEMYLFWVLCLCLGGFERCSTNDAWLDDDDLGTKVTTPLQLGAVDEVDSKSRRGFEVRPSTNGSDSGGNRSERRMKRSNILTVLIGLYQAILRRCEDDCHPPGQHLLLGPVAHLIGLVCATGVSVRDLRLLIVMIEGGLPSLPSSLEVGARAGNGLGTLARLHIIRGLRYAAEYSVRGNAKLDRPGPRVSHFNRFISSCFFVAVVVSVAQTLSPNFLYLIVFLHLRHRWTGHFR